MPLIRIDCKRIEDWDTFHNVFAKEFGFPGFYGRNMDAWIDCMSYLDDPESYMTTVVASASDPAVLQLDNVDSLPDEIYKSLVECAGFVNWRRVSNGDAALLVLSFYRSPQGP